MSLMTRPRPWRRAAFLGSAVAVLASTLAVAPAALPAHAADPVTLTQVESFDNPIAYVTRPSTGASYVATKGGRVYLLRPADTPLLALDMHTLTRSSGERGLLGLAFHPTLNYVYVSYTSPGGTSMLSEFAVRTDGTIRRSSRRLVLSKSQPFSNHNGGHIAFGPDGYLYMGFGDGGSGGDPRRYALKMNTWLGKIIRINPRPLRSRRYQVPASNPFVGVKGAKSEIWSIGLRNPWRWSFDSATGDLWIGDVGQGNREEVDLAKAADGGGKGISFGWSAYEGSDRYNTDQPAGGHQLPLYEYTHGDDECSITGGVVYRGSAVPSLVGAYLFADFCSGKVWKLTLSGDTPTVTQITTVANPVSFGTDAAGEVYILSLGGGVYRMDPAA